MTTSRPRTVRRIAAGAAALTALAGCGSARAAGDSTSTAPSSSVAAPTPDVIRLHASQVNEVQLPGGVGDALIGNAFIDHWALDDAGTPSGDLSTSCQIVDGSESGSSAQCTATATLDAGQITMGGIVKITQDSPGSFDLAITGGTGAYDGAAGTVHVTPSGPTDEQIEIQVVR